MTDRAAARVRVCRWAAVLVYVFALTSTTFSEAFGPADPDMSVNWDARTVERTFDGSPVADAGVHSGDVIDRINGRRVRSYIDWFSVRSLFERDRFIEFDLVRSGQPISVAVPASRANWQEWTNGTIAFRVVRVIVLTFAIAVAFGRPRSAATQVLALILAMIATAEAFPPSGWAAHLRYLPFPVALAATFGSVSWLLIVFPGCVLGALVGRRRFGRVLVATIALPVLVFTPLIIRSCVLFVNAAEITPIYTAAGTGLIQSIWGFVPQLFIGVAAPAVHVPLLIGWAVSSMGLFLVAVALAAPVFSNDLAIRRRARVTLGCAAAGFTIGLHNVFARNWVTFFSSEPPRLFGTSGLVVEAALFVTVLAIAGRYLLRARS